MRTAWNIGGDVRRSLAAHHLHSIFKFHPLRTKAKTRILRPTVILPPSSMPPKRLSVMSKSTLSLLPKRSPSQHSDGGGEHSSTRFGESCSDEEEELDMESEETWNMISI